MGSLPVTPGTPGQTYTQTSLLAPSLPEDDHWDVRHNVTARGFQSSASEARSSASSSASETPGFRSVAAPITKPGHVSSGPPPIKEYVAYRTEVRGRQGGQGEVQGTVLGPGGASALPQGLAANLSKLANVRGQQTQQPGNTISGIIILYPATSSHIWRMGSEAEC